jgi:hypothetical protein
LRRAHSASGTVSGATETDAGLFADLRRLHAAGALALELDHRRLSHIDSPVAVEAESNRIVYGGLVLTGLVWWFFGAWVGMAVAAACLLFYLTFGKADVRRRTARRVEERALADLAAWRKLWRFGGVVLVARHDRRRCAAPQDNWMQFVRELGPPT